MNLRGFSPAEPALAVSAEAAMVVSVPGQVVGIGPQGPPGAVPVRFSAPTAVLGVSASDYCYGPRTLSGARMRVASAPQGSALTVVVQHWDGFAWNDLATLSIAAGSVTEATASFVQAQTVGNMVRINCTSVGSTTAATGVAVDVVT